MLTQMASPLHEGTQQVSEMHKSILEQAKGLYKTTLERIIWDGPNPPTKPELGACWLWTGRLNNSGYGPHRRIYKRLMGRIPTGLTTDHLCKVKRCVNPLHLEVVTYRENMLRSDSSSAINSRKTHCKWGHPFSPENTTGRRGRPCRICRECHRIRESIYYHKKTGKPPKEELCLRNLRLS